MNAYIPRLHAVLSLPTIPPTFVSRDLPLLDSLASLDQPSADPSLLAEFRSLVSKVKSRVIAEFLQTPKPSRSGGIQGTFEPSPSSSLPSPPLSKLNDSTDSTLSPAQLHRYRTRVRPRSSGSLLRSTPAIDDDDDDVEENRKPARRVAIDEDAREDEEHRELLRSMREMTEMTQSRSRLRRKKRRHQRSRPKPRTRTTRTRIVAPPSMKKNPNVVRKERWSSDLQARLLLHPLSSQFRLLVEHLFSSPSPSSTPPTLVPTAPQNTLYFTSPFDADASTSTGLFTTQHSPSSPSPPLLGVRRFRCEERVVGTGTGVGTGVESESESQVVHFVYVSEIVLPYVRALRSRGQGPLQAQGGVIQDGMGMGMGTGMAVSSYDPIRRLSAIRRRTSQRKRRRSQQQQGRRRTTASTNRNKRRRRRISKLRQNTRTLISRMERERHLETQIYQMQIQSNDEFLHPDLEDHRTTITPLSLITTTSSPDLCLTFECQMFVQKNRRIHWSSEMEMIVMYSVSNGSGWRVLWKTDEVKSTRIVLDRNSWVLFRHSIDPTHSFDSKILFEFINCILTALRPKKKEACLFGCDRRMERVFEKLTDTMSHGSSVKKFFDSC